MTEYIVDYDIRLPQLHRRSLYVRIVAWLREEGDQIRCGDSLLVMETDKATVDLHAEAAGVLTEIVQQAGEWVPVHTKVGVIGLDPK